MQHYLRQNMQTLKYATPLYFLEFGTEFAKPKADNKRPHNKT